MARRDQILEVDDHAMRHGGRIIPLKNIAYLNKVEIRSKSVFARLLFVLALLILIVTAFVSARHRANTEFLQVVGLAEATIFGTLILRALFRRRQYGLEVQTNAGDNPVLFMTKKEAFLDSLISDVELRLRGTGELPTLIANIENQTIQQGDMVMGDKVKGTKVVGEYVKGDKFGDVSGNLVNRSKIEGSIEQVAENHGSDIGQALGELATFIEKSGNKKAAEIFEAFSEEAAKSRPRKSTLQALWAGIERVLPGVSTLADITSKLIKLFI